MKVELATAITQLNQRFKNPQFVRAVLTGERRNIKPDYVRVDIKPVLIKGEVKLQIISSDGKKDTTKNVDLDFDFRPLLHSGYANLLSDCTTDSYYVRVSKKDVALLGISKVKLERDLSHDRQKKRMLPESHPIFKALGMSDMLGRIKPGKIDKYKQVDEFLRLMNQLIDDELKSKSSVSVVDLGCGHAYLTFAINEFLKDKFNKVSILGVDERKDSKVHNDALAKELNLDAKFIADKIANTPSQQVDITLALHACDTATDDAIAWAVKNNSKIIMVAPCCMHQLQTQVTNSPKPWSVLTRYGLIKERLVDLMTDSLRAQILKLLGYKVDIVEFIGGEHTMRNVLIRATKTNQKATASDIDSYLQFINLWQVKPYLAKLLSAELKTSARI